MAAEAASRTHQHGNERRTFWAAMLTGVFMLAEFGGGVIAGSLALIADAAHMLTDAVSLGFAWYAFRLSGRPADAARSYGFDRLQILVAFANGIALFFVVGWVFYEAASRLFEPVEVLGGTMLVVALAGLAANLLAFAVLHGGDRENLNIRGALLHVLGDILGSVAAIVAAIVIVTTGWTPIDPLLSGLVGLILLRGAWRLVSQAGHILLEGTPGHLSVAEIQSDLVAAIPEVDDVHHIHVWSLTQERPLITLHARICDDSRPEDAVARIKARLKERFAITHATVEIERADCADHAAAPREGREPGPA